MELYLISNNLVENNLSFSDKMDIEQKKMTRPLSSIGETLAKNLAVNDMFENVTSIYSSLFASSLGTAKYLAERLNKIVLVDEGLNDCKVGVLGNKSLKMIKFMQNHDFNIKLNNGESLTEVGNRIENTINKILYTNNKKVVIFTHKRSILGYLIKHAKSGYNLEDNLILEFNESVIFNDEEKDADIIKITYDKKEILNIESVDF